jgi:hypothetical protein
MRFPVNRWAPVSKLGPSAPGVDPPHAPSAQRAEAPVHRTRPTGVRSITPRSRDGQSGLVGYQRRLASAVECAFPWLPRSSQTPATGSSRTTVHLKRGPRSHPAEYVRKAGLTVAPPYSRIVLKQGRGLASFFLPGLRPSR